MRSGGRPYVARQLASFLCKQISSEYINFEEEIQSYLGDAIFDSHNLVIEGWPLLCHERFKG
jgi:hypothetical protein